MDRQYTPEFYYTISPDFNYREYLEKRSHFDRVVISLDDQTAAIVGGGQQLAQRISGAANTISGQIAASGLAIESQLSDIDDSLVRIDETLQRGFETVTVELQNLNQGIVELQDALTYGLNSLIDETRRSNELLTQLLQKVETPDQVWAEEKFKAAKGCVDRQLWHEALEFSNKAIDGDERNSGYKLEPAFYFLRGRILEGLIGTDVDLVDPAAARSDFLFAYRYAGPEDDYFKKLSLTRAGWCAYCAEDLSAAREHLYEAAKLAPTVPEAEFLLSKVLVRLGEVDKAKQPLLKCISQDSFFCFRIASDADFHPHMETVRDWLEEYRSKLLKELDAWKKDNVQTGLLDELLELASDGKTNHDALDEIKRTTELVNEESFLSDLIDIQASKPEMMQARHSFVLEKSQEIKDAIDKSLSLQPQTVVPSVTVKGEAGAVSDAGLSGVFIGALIGLGLAVIQIIREASSQNWFDAFFTVIFGAIIYGIMGVVLGALGGWLVGLVLGFSKNSAKVSSETARQERNQREAQKRRDAEVVEINKKKNLAKDLQSKFETVKAKLFTPG